MLALLAGYQRYLLGLAAIAVAAGGLYVLGRIHGAGACEQDHLANTAVHLQRAAEQAREIALQDAEVSAETAKVITRIRTVESAKQVEVKNEVQPDCNLCAVTPRGKLLLNDALSGWAFKTPDTAESPRAVPPAFETPPGYFPGDNGQTRRNFSPAI